jgi:hypothetical protein
MMYAIRPYLLLIVIAIIVGAVAGTAPAVWTAAAGAACMVLNSSASYIDPDQTKTLQRMRENLAQGASPEKAMSGGAALILIRVCEFGSILLAIASSIALGVIYGWLPALGIIIAFLGYAALRHSEEAKTRRLALKTRETICSLVADYQQGRITQEQMITRSYLALDKGLTPIVCGVPAYYELVIAARGLSPAGHRMLLGVLEAYLVARDGPAPRHYKMHTLPSVSCSACGRNHSRRKAPRVQARRVASPDERARLGAGSRAIP